jgi:hypothetical protein
MAHEFHQHLRHDELGPAFAERAAEVVGAGIFLGRFSETTPIALHLITGWFKAIRLSRD